MIGLYLIFQSSLFAQFGNGGGFGGEVGDFDQFGIPKNANFIETASVLVTISNSKKVVYAFSHVTGTATAVRLKVPLENFIPIVGDNVAVFSQGKTAYGFSAMTGKWEAIKTAGIAIVPIVGRDVICFANGGKQYAFGAKHGKWMVIDVDKETEANSVPIISGSGVKVHYDNKIFICSANSKEWTVIDLSKDD